VCAVAEVQQRVRGAVVAHLVVQADKGDVIAGAVGQEFRDDEQRDAFDARGAARNFGQHKMDDVLRQFVVAAGDPHLGSGDAVGAVGGGDGLGGDVGQRRACVGFRQAHGAEVSTLQHRANPRVDLLRGPVFDQQVRVADGQEGVRGRAGVGGTEELQRRLRHHRRQLHTADRLIERSGHQARSAERVQCGFDVVDQDDLPVRPDGRMALVALLVVRRKAFRRDIGGQIQHGVEGVARVFGEMVALGQLDDIEPLVEQKVDVAA
jgi:hypothetical protein